VDVRKLHLQAATATATEHRFSCLLLHTAATCRATIQSAAGRTPATHAWPDTALQQLKFPLCLLFAAASAALAAAVLLLLLSLLHTWPEYTPSGAMVRVFCSLYLTGSRYTTCSRSHHAHMSAEHAEQLID
jgi:hypothetical protein